MVVIEGFTLVVVCGISVVTRRLEELWYVISYQRRIHGYMHPERSHPMHAAHLKIRCPESPSIPFIIKDLNFEGEVFSKLFQQQHKEWQTNTKRL